MIAERPGVGQSAALRRHIVDVLSARGAQTSGQLWVAVHQTGSFSRSLLHLQLDLLLREGVVDRAGDGGHRDPYVWTVAR